MYYNSTYILLHNIKLLKGEYYMSETTLKLLELIKEGKKLKLYKLLLVNNK